MALMKIKKAISRKSGPVTLTNDVTESQYEKQLEDQRRQEAIRRNPRLAGKLGLSQAATVLGLEPFEFADIRANQYDLFTAKQDYSIKSKHCSFVVDTRPSWAHKPFDDYKFFRVATFAMVWIALKGRSKGVVTVSIRDLSYSKKELQTEIQFKMPVKENFAILGALPDFMAIEDRKNLVVSIDISDDSLKDCVLSRSIWFWGIEQTDLPISMKPQDAIMFNYEPLTPTGLNNLVKFKDFCTNVATRAVDKAFKNKAYPEIETEAQFGIQVQPERVSFERKGISGVSI
jgi:hypothetical protein